MGSNCPSTRIITEYFFIDSRWILNFPEIVVTSAVSPVAMVRLLIKASGLSDGPDIPLSLKKEDEKATSLVAWTPVCGERVERGKKGSFTPLPPKSNTDWGIDTSNTEEFVEAEGLALDLLSAPCALVNSPRQPTTKETRKLTGRKRKGFMVSMVFKGNWV
jgi:hypothetical protein